MDGGRTQENGRVRKEDAGAFERRTVGTDAQGHRQYGLLEHHGDSAVAYTPVEFSSADSEAGRAAPAFTKNGIRAPPIIISHKERAKANVVGTMTAIGEVEGRNILIVE